MHFNFLKLLERTLLYLFPEAVRDTSQLRHHYTQ